MATLKCFKRGSWKRCLNGAQTTFQRERERESDSRCVCTKDTKLWAPSTTPRTNDSIVDHGDPTVRIREATAQFPNCLLRGNGKISYLASRSLFAIYASPWPRAEVESCADQRSGLLAAHRSPTIVNFRSFEKGLADKGGLVRRNPSHATMPEIEAAFLHPFSYAPLRRRGTHFCTTFLLFWGFVSRQPCPANPFSKPLPIENRS